MTWVQRPTILSSAPTRFKRGLPVVLALVAFSSGGLAAPDLIASSKSIFASLAAARSGLGSDPASSYERVQSAQNAFRTVSSEIGSQQLANGGIEAFKNALAAVSRKSGADLDAQTTQIEGILNRALYDRYFNELATNNVNTATRYATALAGTLKLSKDAQKRLTDATRTNSSERARSLLEGQVASAMSNALTKAKTSSDRAVMFRETARASNAFLVVQDSPRVGDLTVSAFSQAIKSLTQNDTAGFKQSLEVLTGKTTAFARRARGLAATAPAGTAKPAATTSKPATTTKPVATTSKPVATKPTPVASSTPAPAPSPAPASPVVAPVAATPSSDGIMKSLMGAGMAQSQADRFAKEIASKGYTELRSATDRFQADLAKALTQTEVGDLGAARASLEQARSTYHLVLKGPLEAINPDAGNRLVGLLDATIGANGLRPADVTVLIGEAQNATGVFDKTSGGGWLHDLIVAVQPVWMLLRPGLFLIVALLFAYPLYLLQLSFGGRNPYWRYIGITLVLAFLPALIEGLAGLGSLLASLTGVGFFSGLAGLSILQNPLAQIIWVLVLLATVVFATLGFRGIAEQFGLLQSRNPNTTPTVIVDSGSAITGVHTTSMGTLSTRDTGGFDKTIVEWDEEF